MDLSSLGKIIVALGVMLVLIGGLVWVLGKTDLPLGRLPGDIRIEGEKGSCYAPIVTMIVLSVVLTIILNVVIRLLIEGSARCWTITLPSEQAKAC